MPTDYYDAHAEAFFDDTFCVDLSDLHARFRRYLPPRARVLDAGCGSGRDALAFHQAGYEVTAFDGSSKMVALARSHTGLPVQHLTFDEVAWEAAFDGVWASASLLHVPRDRLVAVTVKLARTLRPGGVMFASFKYGEAERLKDGRHFTDQTEASLQRLLTEVGLDVRETWNSADVRPGRAHERWVSALAAHRP
jgi:2-polyprenyl-3-methyl-5-hydroxy-6-metoxy-1,4-benzoquinol methylase